LVFMGEADRRWLLRGAVVTVALVVALIAWRATSEDDEVAAAPEAAWRLVSPGELGEIAAIAGHPVYWAGPRPGAKPALSEDATGNVQVRYLDDASELEEDRGENLTVGSYPLPDPKAASANLAADPGAIVKRSPDGTELVSTEESPDSVYFADPDNAVQVEVYDPSPGRAMALARSGKIVPAG
jgi:hypothetical protein